jgi:DNA-binding transcriptional regulator YdaS (Cro superfamily)
MDLYSYLHLHNLTVQEFAARIPAHPNTVHNWLKYRASPRAHHIQRVDELTKGKVKCKDWNYYLEAKKKYG